MDKKISQLIRPFLKDAIELRLKFHQIPELKFQEEKTGQLIVYTKRFKNWALTSSVFF